MYCIASVCRRIFVVEKQEPLEQQVVIEQDFVAAERRDHTREAARRDDRARLAELRVDAVDQAVERAGVSVQNAALHAVDRVRADQAFRHLKRDLLKLRRAADQRIARDDGARQNHAAAVIAAAVDDGDRRRRAHINDDLRQGIIVDARHGVYDEVAAELGGVVDLNAQARLDAGADDERRNVQVFLNGGLHRAGHGRHDGRDDRAVDVCGVDAVHLKRGAQDRGVFQHGGRVDRRNALAEENRFTAAAAEHNIGVSDVDGENHSVNLPYLYRLRLRARAAPCTAQSRPRR